MYSSRQAEPTFNPEYFRKAAILYNANPTDRKQWLSGQIINLQAALNQYSAEIQNLVNTGATLDGKSNAANWLTSIGAIAVTIPTPYTLIGGAVVSLAGVIVGAAKKKKDSKALIQLAEKAQKIQIEAGQIQAYYEQYTAELNKITYLPLALFGAAAYIITQ